MAAAAGSNKRQTGARGGGGSGRSLCDNCVWDCVQPLGTTILCPAYRPRPEGEPRQPRRGQQSFAFDCKAESGERAPGSRRHTEPPTN